MRDVDNTIGIIETLRELRRLYGHAPTYQTLWQHVASGNVPAERGARAWRIQRADIPQIAELLKLTDRAA